MNYLTIKNIFEKEYNQLLKSGKIIFSAKGKETFEPTLEETFKQIYVPSKNKVAKYIKFRSKFHKNYFISNKGTLLKLQNNTIFLMENVDKNSRRRAYFLPLISRKKPLKLRDYQLMAFVFESQATEKADQVLKNYGINALNKGIEVHHIEGLDFNNPSHLEIIMSDEHHLLTKNIPSDSQEAYIYLNNISKMLEGNKNPSIILTENYFDIEGNKLKNLDNRSSQIITLENNDDINNLNNEINKMLKNTYLPYKIVSYEGKLCKLYFNNETKDGFLVNDNNVTIARLPFEKLRFNNFI